MKILPAAAALCLLAVRAHAQDTTLAPWRREVISSAKLGEQRSILVATPEGYQTGPIAIRC